MSEVGENLARVRKRQEVGGLGGGEQGLWWRWSEGRAAGSAGGSAVQLWGRGPRLSAPQGTWRARTGLRS